MNRVFTDVLVLNQPVTAWSVNSPLTMCKGVWKCERQSYTASGLLASIAMQLPELRKSSLKKALESLIRYAVLKKKHTGSHTGCPRTITGGGIEAQAVSLNAKNVWH